MFSMQGTFFEERQRLLKLKALLKYKYLKIPDSLRIKRVIPQTETHSSTLMVPPDSVYTRRRECSSHTRRAWNCFIVNSFVHFSAVIKQKMCEKRCANLDPSNSIQTLLSLGITRASSFENCCLDRQRTSF